MSVHRLLREPLLHFLGIGVLLFLLYALVSPGDSGNGRITVSATAVANLEAQHRKLWGRAPGKAELNGLIESYVDEEIMYREGVSMGLDRDDTVIKRRVVQKYDLVTDDSDNKAPTDTELSAWMRQHPDKFRQPPVIGFTQVLLPETDTPTATKANAGALKLALERGADPQTAGKPTLLQKQFESRALDAIARELGDGIGTAVANAPVGKWIGPVASPFGIHLLRVDTRTDAVSPAFASIRPQVLREWENARRVEAREARLKALRQDYTIVIERNPAS